GLLLACENNRSARVLRALQRDRHYEPRSRIQRNTLVGCTPNRIECKITSSSNQHNGRYHPLPRKWTFPVAPYWNNVRRRRDSRSFYVRMDLPCRLSTGRDYQRQGAS